MIGYLLLCFIAILTGRGILFLTQIRVDFKAALFLAPVIAMAFWSLFLGWGVLFGFPVKQLWFIGWTVSLLLALYGLKNASLIRSQWLLLSSVIIIPVGLMAPYFWYGLQSYSGSGFWDGWSYIAFGQYLWEYPNGTEGGLGPLYQYAAHLSQTRFIASAFLAFFSPLAGSLRDARAASGYFLAWAIFVFSSACMYFILSIPKPQVVQTSGSEQKKWPLLVYTVTAAFSGWILSMLSVNNYDNALGLSFLPVLVANSYSLDHGEWRWSVILGMFGAAAFFCYPEMAPFVLLGVFPVLIQRILLEKTLFNKIAILIGTALAIFVVLASPYIHQFFLFLLAQCHQSMDRSHPRPGEGFFPQLLNLRDFLPAFWGIGTSFDTWPHSMSKFREYIKVPLAISLTALSIIGLANLFMRKLWGIASSIVLLLCGMAIMILWFDYSYGAYKFILLNWWGAIFAVFFGMSAIVSKVKYTRESTKIGFGSSQKPIFVGSRVYRQIIYAPFIVLLLAYIWAIGDRIVAYDKRFVLVKKTMTLRKVQKIKSFIGEDPVMVNVRDDYANAWAVYYLRNMHIQLLDYHGYMAQQHVIPLMNRAEKVDFSRACYVLTDGNKIICSCPLELKWRGGPYQLWKISQKKYVIFNAPINSNGIEGWNGKVDFWLGKREAVLQLVTSYKGEAYLRGRFFLGTGLPENKEKTLLLSSDRGCQKTITIENDGDQVFSIPVVSGINRITMKLLDDPGVKLQSNNDSTPLLIGVCDVTVMNDDLRF